MMGSRHGREKKQNHGRRRMWLASLVVLAASTAGPTPIAAESASQSQREPSPTGGTTAEDVNRRLQELVRQATSPEGGTGASLQDYRIGANDLLTIKVFEAPELSQPVRVSAGGEITLPLIGVVAAGNLTPRELELVLQELLRRDFIKDPHVSVHVAEMESHAVSVMGAVKQPGVVQIRGSRSLLEVLALAGGLAADAGSRVQVVRKPTSESSPADDGAAAVAHAEQLEVDLNTLLASEDQSQNVLIHPGDIVKVLPAEMIYVVGEVRKPGGFPLTSTGRLTVLGALALGEGLTPAAAKGDALIIRTDEDGQHSKIPVDLGQLLKGKTPDISLQAQDIVFVPGSVSKAIARGGADVLFRMLTFRAVVF